MKILFVTYGGGHVQMVAPVVRLLREAHPEIVVECIALTTAQPALQRMGIAFRPLTDFTALFPDAATRWGQELSAEYHSDAVGIALAESVAYLGLSFWDLVQTHGQTAARNLLAERGLHAFLQRHVMRRIVDELAPTVIATTNSPRMEYAAVLAGKAVAIPTFTMVDLFGRFNFCPIVADHVSVLSPKTRSNLIDTGLMPRAVDCHYFGNPSFDRYLAARPGDAKPVGHQNPGLLFLDMPAFLDMDRNAIHSRGPDEVSRDLDDLARACAANDLDLLIRPHPSQDRAVHENWRAGSDYGHRCRILAGGALEPVLRQATLVIARSSTSLLEAVFCGCRTLQINYQKTDDIDLPLAHMGLSWPVRHRRELSAVVTRAITDETVFAKQQELRLDLLPTEPATPRVAEFLTKLAVGKV